jgi:hypothetical protein
LAALAATTVAIESCKGFIVSLALVNAATRAGGWACHPRDGCERIGVLHHGPGGAQVGPDGETAYRGRDAVLREQLRQIGVVRGGCGPQESRRCLGHNLNLTSWCSSLGSASGGIHRPTGYTYRLVSAARRGLDFEFGL